MAELPLPEAARASDPGPFARLRGAPATTSLALLGVLLGAYGIAIVASGNLAGVIDPEAPLHLLRIFRFNLVLTGLLAFTVWALLTEPPHIAADLAALRPHVELPPEAFEAHSRRVFEQRAVASLGFAVGGALGIAVVVAADLLEHRGWSGWRWDFHTWWVSFLTFALFGAMGANGLSSARAMRVFSELGRHARVRLLAPEALRPFARRGLRWARYWFMGSALAVLLVVNSDQPAVVVPIIAITLAFGHASLLLPSLGVHERLRAAKREELARVREAVERRSAALLEERAAPEADPDIPSLLAYESRIQSVSEWPFDTPTLLRFSLLVLIPLASWVGGAVVERIVDAVLG